MRQVIAYNRLPLYAAVSRYNFSKLISIHFLKELVERI